MNTKRIITTLLVTSAIAWSSLSNAGAGIRDKQIVAQEVESHALSVKITPNKAAYIVNEAIRLNVTGNKDFFLYLFSVDENNQNATLLFPHRLHKGNKFKREHNNLIPSKKVEFISDRPGKEKLIAIASTRYFNWDTTGYTAAGKFLQTSRKQFDRQVKAFQISSRQAEPQGRRLSTTNTVSSDLTRQDNALNNQTTDVHIQEVFTTIEAKNNAQQNLRQQVTTADVSPSNVAELNNQRAIVFSGTDKKVYKNNELVNILVGADKPGTLHLFTAEPNGKLVFLTKQKVDGKRFVKIKAEAIAPFGTHALVVAYSKQGPVNGLYLKRQYSKKALVGQAKGLRLIQKPEPVAYSMTQFRITK